jgi:hypothetical protein
VLASIASAENSVDSKDVASKAIRLPKPRTDGGISVKNALLERRSIRALGKEGLTIDEVSQLLWSALGVKDNKGHRTAPSAMESYPLQVSAENVRGLPSWVYHYLSQGHNLTVITQGRIAEYYNAAAGSETWIKRHLRSSISQERLIA